MRVNSYKTSRDSLNKIGEDPKRAWHAAAGMWGDSDFITNVVVWFKKDLLGNPSLICRMLEIGPLVELAESQKGPVPKQFVVIGRSLLTNMYRIQYIDP